MRFTYLRGFYAMSLTPQAVIRAPTYFLSSVVKREVISLYPTAFTPCDEAGR